MSPAPHSRWDSINVGESSSLASRFFSFFLSECDVGASKAVVNGLAPGSNGQDKGKALEGKPDGSWKVFLEGAEDVGPGPPAS